MRTTILVSLLFLIITVTSGTAQFWEQTNGALDAKTSDAVVGKNGHIFVVSDVLHRSTDDGKTWTRIFIEAPITTLGKILSLESGRLIVSRKNTSEGLWKSDNDGASWEKLNMSSALVWSGAKNEIFSYENDSITVSTDEGNSWNRIGREGISGAPSNITSNATGTIFVTTSAFYRSTDRGTSWSKITNGLYDHQQYANILIVDDSTMFTYMYNDDQNFAYRSRDAGRTWNRINDDITQLAGYDFRAIHMNRNKTLLIEYGGYNSNYYIYSTDKGNTWIKSTIRGDEVLDNDDTSGRFIAQTTSGFERIDILNSKRDSTSTPATTTSYLLAHPNNIVVGIEKKGTLSYTPDDAAVWHGCSFVNDVETPHVAQVLSSGSDVHGNIYITGVGGYIRTSSDHGVSWSGLSTPTQKDITGICIYPSGERMISTSGEGIFRSTDGGKTWDQLNSGIANRQLYSLTMASNGDLFAGGIGAIYYSSNKGLTWSSLTTPFIDNTDTVRTLRLSEKGNIIAVVDSLGVYWSSDNGNSWQIRGGNINAKRINALIATRNELLFAATDNGVFMLDTIIGSSWQQINDGLTSMNVLSICQDYKGRLYIGTEASGVFRSSQLFDKPSIPEAVKQTSGIARSSSLGAIYPNPSRTKITIPFTLIERGQTQIEVIDALGKTVSRIEEGYLGSGGYESTFDASALPNGTYIIRMNTNGKSYYEQFVVAK